jgi:hypothetical protein
LLDDRAAGCKKTARRRDGQSASTGDGETANFLPFLIPGKFGKFGKFDPLPITHHSSPDR